MTTRKTTAEDAHELWLYSVRGGGWEKLSEKARAVVSGGYVAPETFAQLEGTEYSTALARKVELDSWAWAALGYAVAPIRDTYYDPQGKTKPNDGKRCQARFSRGCHLPTNTRGSLEPSQGMATIATEYGGGVTGLAIVAQHCSAPLALVDIDDATFPQSRAVLTALQEVEYMDIVTGANRMHIYLRDTLPGKLAEIMQVKNELGAEAFSLRRGDSYLVAPGSYRTGKGKDHWWFNPLPSKILTVAELGEAPQALYDIPRKQRKAARRTRGVDIEAFIREHKIEAQEHPWEGGKRYKVCCPWAELHSNDDPEAAIGVGGDGVVWFRCMHGHCEDKGWEEYRAAVDPDYKAKKAIMFERGDGAELASYLLDELLEGAVYDRALEQWFVPGDIGYTPLPKGVRRDEALTPYVAELARGETYVQGDKGAKRFRYTQQLVRDAAACARSDALGELDARPIIAFANGGFELVGRELVLLQEVAPVTFVRPYAYHPIPAGLEFDTAYAAGRFLRTAFRGNEEDGRVLASFVGLCLLGLGTKLQQLVFCEGPGKTGKGVAAALIASLFSPWRLSSTTPDRMGEKFGLAQLDKAHLNLVMDYGKEESIKESGILKSLIAGDAVEYERKGVDIDTITPKAGHLLFGNGYPRVYGAEWPFWRRITVIHMLNIIAEEARDLNLVDTLRTPREQEYFVALCIAEGLAALERRHLLPEATRLARLDDWRKEDVVLKWAHGSLEHSDSATGIDTLYATFRSWCDAEGIRPSYVPRRQTFANRLGEEYLRSSSAGFLCRVVRG